MTAEVTPLRADPPTGIRYGQLAAYQGPQDIFARVSQSVSEVASALSVNEQILYRLKRRERVGFDTAHRFFTHVNGRLGHVHSRADWIWFVPGQKGASPVRDAALEHACVFPALRTSLSSVDWQPQDFAVASGASIAVVEHALKERPIVRDAAELMLEALSKRTGTALDPNQHLFR